MKILRVLLCSSVRSENSIRYFAQGDNRKQAIKNRPYISLWPLRKIVYLRPCTGIEARGRAGKKRDRAGSARTFVGRNGSPVFDELFREHACFKRCGQSPGDERKQGRFPKRRTSPAAGFTGLLITSEHRPDTVCATASGFHPSNSSAP